MTSPAVGCTSCGSADTVTIDGVNGRRCAACPPGLDPEHAVRLSVRGLPGAAGAYVRATLPTGDYLPDLAEHMVVLGRADAAFTYLGAFLTHEADRRFAAAARALDGAR